MAWKKWLRCMGFRRFRLVPQGLVQRAASERKERCGARHWRCEAIADRRSEAQAISKRIVSGTLARSDPRLKIHSSPKPISI